MADLDAEVGVVGLGAWGASTLWRLARRGVDVLGVERFQPGHSFGSSHGGSRMYRLTCYEHRGLVPLAQRSLALWEDLEELADVPLLERSGGLMIGAPSGRMVRDTLANARDFGLPVECLDAAELRERFPQHVGVDPGHVGVWEPAAGLVRPEAAVTAAVDAGVRAGARVFGDARVTRLELVPGGVVLHTSTREFRVRQAVVAVGSWSPSFFPHLPLRTVRRPITWFAADAPEEFDLGRFPMFKRECAGELVLWGCGRCFGDETKLGLEARGGWIPPTIDPDVLDRSTSVEDWRALADLVSETVPGVRPVPTRVAVCIGSLTPDGQFVLGRPGGDPRLVVAAGENSQGFKHATGIGEALADVVTDEPAKVSLAFADPDRFR